MYRTFSLTPIQQSLYTLTLVRTSLVLSGKEEGEQLNHSLVRVSFRGGGGRGKSGLLPPLKKVLPP